MQYNRYSLWLNYGKNAVGEHKYMKKSTYIKKNSDFKKVYSKGSSVADWLTVVYKFPNKLNETRFGFSVSKKIGNAVIRNKVKRTFREICRINNENILKGFDIVIIARNPIKDKSYHDIEKSIIKLFRKSKILKEDS